MSLYTQHNGMAGAFRPCRGQGPHVRRVILKLDAARTAALMARLFTQKRKKHRRQKARRETAVPDSRPPARVGRKSEDRKSLPRRRRHMQWIAAELWEIGRGARKRSRKSTG